MTVLRQEILRIAKLAHLEIPDVELERHTGEFDRFLQYVEVLRAAGPLCPVVEGCAHSVLRDDEVSNPADDGSCLAQAPALYENFVPVPRILEF